MWWHTVMCNVILFANVMAHCTVQCDGTPYCAMWYCLLTWWHIVLCNVTLFLRNKLLREGNRVVLQLLWQVLSVLMETLHTTLTHLVDWRHIIQLQGFPVHRSVSNDSVIKFTSGFIRASNGISKTPSKHKRATMTHGVPFNGPGGPYSLHGAVSVYTVCSG